MAQMKSCRHSSLGWLNAITKKASCCSILHPAEGAALVINAPAANQNHNQEAALAQRLKCWQGTGPLRPDLSRAACTTRAHHVHAFSQATCTTRAHHVHAFSQAICTTRAHLVLTLSQTARTPCHQPRAHLATHLVTSHMHNPDSWSSGVTSHVPSHVADKEGGIHRRRTAEADADQAAAHPLLQHHHLSGAACLQKLGEDLHPKVEGAQGRLRGSAP